MPSVSKKQHNFMEAVAHSPSFAKKAGVPRSVGKEFASADEGRKFSGSSPRSREEHMAKRAKQTGQKSTGKEFGVHQSTVSRRMLRDGYSKV